MKEELLHAVDEGREREAELEALVLDGPADPGGRWTAKDHLAHLSWWRWRTARTHDAVRTGGELPPPTLEGDDDAAQNAVIYAEVKDRSASEVKADAAASWAALRAAVEASSEEDLVKPHPRRPESQIWESLPSALGHTGTHVWSWLLDVGERERAISVATWASGIEDRFFTRPDQLADSRYNLACVHARLGQADQALPLLLQAFEAKPELAAWAKKDHDLDGIRHLPEAQRILQ